MARRNENSRHSKYVIRIVCEGDKTEPLFFTDLCDEYCFGNPMMDVRTIPQPPITQEAEEDAFVQRGSYRGKKRRTNAMVTVPMEEVKITGAPPLKWVTYARQLLSEGVDESWAVYDKDEHPLHKEAAEEADRIVDGKKVNIAFSSRSFEYYLLLHFGYLYQSFEKTECGERTKGNKHIYECGTGKDPNDCHGKKCINGYAREHGYWKESKSSLSTYSLVKNNLQSGIVNACRLRAESDRKTTAPFYERNPYTNVDRLVGRLIGCDAVDFGNTCHLDNALTIQLTEADVVCTNTGGTTAVITQEMLYKQDYVTGKRENMMDKNLVLPPKECVTIPYKLGNNQVVSVKCSEKTALLLPKY